MTIHTFFDQPLLVLAAVAVAVLGVGRFTRLVTYDDYPPTTAIRLWWVERVTKGNGWAKLLTCLWCFAPWAMLASLAWLFLGLLYSPAVVIAWFAFWGWLGVSYLTSMVVRRDEPDE